MFQMEVYAAELTQLQTQFPDADSDLTAASRAETEAALRATEGLVGDLQDDVRLLTGSNAISRQSTPSQMPHSD